MPDKSQWPKSTHDFFMHPPLLKTTAGRPQTERHKGCTEKKNKKGQNKCPICLDYGHHWHNCKKGNLDDIAAMMAVRGPPKKRAKTTKSTLSSIVPFEDEAPATSMSYPPSQSLDTTCKTKGKNANSDTGPSSKRCKSRSGSNQPEAVSTEGTVPTKQRPKAKKQVATKKKKEPLKKIPMLPFDSPAMGTKSKRVDSSSPAMSTRSKRRLSL